MNERAVLLKGFRLVVRNPVLWLIGVVAVLGDLSLAFAGNRMASIGLDSLLFAVLSLIAEAGLVYAVFHASQADPPGLIDSIMTALSYGVPLFLVRVALLILLAVATIILFLVMLGVVSFFQAYGADGISIGYGIALVTLVPVLFVLQLFVFFAQCAIVIRDSEFGEALAQAREVLGKHFGAILKLSLVFVAVEILLVALLSVAGGISLEAAFENVAPPQMQQIRAQLGWDEINRYAYSLTQPANFVFTSAWSGRGVEFSRLALLLAKDVNYSVIVVVLGLMLLPLRTAVLTLAYLEFTGPATAMPLKQFSAYVTRPQHMGKNRKSG
jgi:hypothetical protein